MRRGHVRLPGPAELTSAPSSPIDILWSAVGLVGNFKLNERTENHGIPHEIEGNCRYITSDPVAAQYAGAGGTPTITLKIPVRYRHGPVEILDMSFVRPAGGGSRHCEASRELLRPPSIPYPGRNERARGEEGT